MKNKQNEICENCRFPENHEIHTRENKFRCKKFKPIPKPTAEQVVAGEMKC